ncbi:MAG: glycosyltransferase [Lachnospiraceae bacterium]|nr:glycosyltransferase [Lachnospiraceae bacterium]
MTGRKIGTLQSGRRKREKKIVLIEGVYDTIDLFSENVKQALEELGYECLVLHAQDMEESLKEFAVFALTEITAVITFNNLGYNLELTEGKNIWEQFDIPYVNILMDHPFHYKKPLKHMPKTARVYCTDRNHVAFMRRFFPEISRVGFLPHAGIELPQTKRPLKERRIEVLYAGALPFFTAGSLVPDLSAITEFDALDMAKTVLEDLIKKPQETTETAIETYLKERKIQLSEDALFDAIVKMRFLDSYATSFFRENAVRLLVESGIDVTAYGTGWNQCEWSDNPHLHYGGKILAPEVLPLMADAKIVLNTMTWYKAGAHDRIFNGMLAGACVVTDDSSYLRSLCSKDEALVRFQLEEIGALPEKVYNLLEHPNQMQMVADCGYETAKREHTWKNRVLTVLKDLEDEKHADFDL